MLWFEREVVQALGDAPHQATRAAVEAFVDGSLRAMPEVTRLGVGAESLALGTYVRWLRSAGRLADHEDLRRRLDRWEASRFGPVRLYVHMFRSLVVFAENELAPADGGEPVEATA